jgi:hypothetical protein
VTGREDTFLTPDQVGQRLFEALFRGEVLNLYERSIERLELTPSEGLRIKILIDPRNSGMAFLQSLPWELLYSTRDRDFVALSRKKPIVRYLMVPHGVTTLRLNQPLRILVVAPEIQDSSVPRLDLEQELRNLRTALRWNPRIKMVRPEASTIIGIRNTLLRKPCHVIHFMGHGSFDHESSEGYLFFQDEHGGVEKITGVALARALKDFPSLRLLVINACDSAQSGSSSNPFAGVANALILSGLPAVVAMQFPITDEAAIDFSKAFYARLARADSIDAAVAEGRQAVHARNYRSLDWSAPVLFMRCPDGQLFSAERKKTLFKAGAVVLCVLAAVLILVAMMSRGNSQEAPPQGTEATSQGTESQGTESQETELSSTPTEEPSVSHDGFPDIVKYVYGP